MKVEPGRLYRHKKGMTYLVLYLAKSTDEPHDDLVVYQADSLLNSGIVWVRKLSEFADGRFEAVYPDPSPTEQVSERLPIPCRIP